MDLVETVYRESAAIPPEERYGLTCADATSCRFDPR